tara:strand:- start:386 stop:766 length:381 start_codon:yes stop_codon:yes gene_type:complete
MAKAKNGDPLKKLQDTLNIKNKVVKRYVSEGVAPTPNKKMISAIRTQRTPLTPEQKQGIKTLDSIKFEREMHKIDKDYELKRCNTGGVCSSAGTHRRRRESRIMDKQETRAKSLVKGYKVGPNPYK